MPYTKSEWERDRKKLSTLQLDGLRRVTQEFREIQKLTRSNVQRRRKVNNDYERALKDVNKRYAKARGWGMKF